MVLSSIKEVLLHGLLSVRERTSLTSCKAEIRATNEISKMLIASSNLAGSICDDGHDIPDTLELSLAYNDNEACVCWSNMTTKQIRHMEMCENSVREWVQDQSLQVLHVKGKINPADIFIKEMRDGTHF